MSTYFINLPRAEAAKKLPFHGAETMAILKVQ